MLLDGIKDQEKGTIVHICGQMRSVYEQIDKVHSDALSFDAIVPLKEARKNLQDRVLMGNVSTFALEFGDEERVQKLTKFCVQSGSDIISPACGLGTSKISEYAFGWNQRSRKRYDCTYLWADEKRI